MSGTFSGVRHRGHGGGGGHGAPVADDARATVLDAAPESLRVAHSAVRQNVPAVSGIAGTEAGATGCKRLRLGADGRLGKERSGRNSYEFRYEEGQSFAFIGVRLWFLITGSLRYAAEPKSKRSRVSLREEGRRPHAFRYGRRVGA